jgi:cytochrome c oxidase assembly protein Cox11
MMLSLAALYAAVTLYGLILFLTGFSTLPKEVRQSLNPNEIELFDQEMTHRQIIGLLLLSVPVFSLMVYLIFYF